MADFVRWFFSLPTHQWVLIYAVIGLVIGVNLRFILSRHLWVKHKTDDRGEVRNCWCVETNPSNPCISRGDFFALGIYTAPILWPLAAVVMVFILPFYWYGKILGLIHRFAQKGAKRLCEEIHTEKELREELFSLRRRHEEILASHKRIVADLQERAQKAEGELKKRKEDPNYRVDKKLEESQKILDEMDRREPE